MTTNDSGIASGASLEPYPSYKDSGVEWFGEVPEHWEIRRLKHIAEVFPSNVDKHSKEDEAPVRLCNYTDVYYNEIITDDLDLMQATATDAQIEKFELRAGDTIITKDSETADDIAVPAFVPRDMPGVICGYHLSMIRPREGLVGAFVKRLFDSRYIKACVEVRANGLTRVGLGQYALDNLDIPTPPIEEQTAIAAFLDRETAKIDALVEKQRRLIELLKEKRQAVISHAVTKGLNPDAPMKDSGVEWLGEVPEHWVVTKLGRFASVENGSTPSRNNIGYWEGKIPWLSSGDINQRRITSASRFITQAAMNECSLPWIKAGAVVVGMVGQGRTRGLAAIMDVDATINQNMAAVTPSVALDGEYLLLIFESAYEQFRELGRGGNQAALNCDIVSSLVVPVPPKFEQAEIVKAMFLAIEKSDNLIAKCVQTIELLAERRTALISAAVTGKIDVRNHAPASEGVPA